MIPNRLSPGLTINQSQEIQNALQKIEGIGTSIYDRKGQKIYRFCALDSELVAKFYQIKTPVRRLSAALKFSRARRSFRNGLIFYSSGIPTPEPLYLEENRRIAPTEAVVVMKYIAGKTLQQILLDKETPDPSLPQKILLIIRKLQAIRCRHGDFHASNLLISGNGDPTLIDLDGVRRRYSNRALQRNIIEDRDRLVKSVKHSPSFHGKLIEILGKPGSPIPQS